MTLSKLVFASALALTLASSGAKAAEIEGIKMADRVKVDGKPLVLNGMGLRQAKKAFLTFDVYAGALYLTKPSSNAEEIINSDDPKSIEMVFMRDVGGSDIANAWRECREKNCVGNGCDKLKPSFEKVATLMSDVKKGEVMAFNFLPTKVDVLIRGKDVGSVEGKDFSKNMLRCWLGKNPPNEELKQGLLGKKKD